MFTTSYRMTLLSTTMTSLVTTVTSLITTVTSLITTIPSLITAMTSLITAIISVLCVQPESIALSFALTVDQDECIIFTAIDRPQVAPMTSLL